MNEKWGRKGMACTHSPQLNNRNRSFISLIENPHCYCCCCGEFFPYSLLGLCFVAIYCSNCASKLIASFHYKSHSSKGMCNVFFLVCWWVVFENGSYRCVSENDSLHRTVLIDAFTYESHAIIYSTHEIRPIIDFVNPLFCSKNLN